MTLPLRTVKTPVDSMSASGPLPAPCQTCAHDNPVAGFVEIADQLGHM